MTRKIKEGAAQGEPRSNSGVIDPVSSKIITTNPNLNLLAKMVLTRSTWDLTSTENAVLCVDRMSADILLIDSVVISIAEVAAEVTGKPFAARFPRQIRHLYF